MNFIPQCQHYMQGRGASLLPGTVVEVNSFESHGQQRGQAEGRVRLSLGARRMQMAAGLSGHCWSPLVCRCAVCSGCAGEPQDHQHIGCLQRRYGLIRQTAHLLLLSGRKRGGIQIRK